MAAPRNVTPFIAAIRDFLGQKAIKNHLRFEGASIVARSQPPPVMPPGVSHKLNTNYYYNRDGRRTIRPPIVSYDQAGPKQLTEGATSSSTAVAGNLPPKAGFGYDHTSGKPLW